MNSALASVLALVVVVPVFLIAAGSVLGLIRGAFRVETQIRSAQVRASALLVAQLDEETGVRGFAMTRRRAFLEPYVTSVPEFADVSAQLHAELNVLGVPVAAAALDEMVSLNGQWRSRFAEPILAHPQRAVALLLLDKQLIDAERVDYKAIADALSVREGLAQAQTSASFVRATVLAVAATLVIGGIILALGISRTRFEAELERERRLVLKLQEAFIHRRDSLPGVGIGTEYLSATEDALVGGDVFDVRRVDEHLGYVLVADVSGKGIEAAVDTAFIKFSIRALAHDGGDPGEVLRAFNRLVVGSLARPDAFVVAFLAFLDSQTGTLRYASAGHAGAFLRRGTAVSQLRVTGPIVGLGTDQSFATATLSLEPGDMLVIATDGLTEARNDRRTLLGDEEAMRWIAEAKAKDAQGIANELVRRLKHWIGSNRLDDDLAIVVAIVDGGRSPAAAVASEAGAPSP